MLDTREAQRRRPLRAAPLFMFVVVALGAGACAKHEEALLPRSQTWAELRVVRRAIEVTPPNESARAPYPRERLVDGEAVHVKENGLAWVRRDGGATFLVKGPAELVLRADGLEVTEGHVFVDTPPGVTAQLKTPSGPIYLAEVRASIDVHGADKTTEAYVLSGELRSDNPAKVEGGVIKDAHEARAAAGERITLKGEPGKTVATIAPATVWDDWTGGLATTDRAAEPAPFGVGTVGARAPGAEGQPRFPLAIQKLDVRVAIDHELAITEVEEVFFNPSSQNVEGIYRFRTPEGATLHRFGVDRDGVTVWGRVKEKAAAAAQYQANVYQGSTEDPALLEWEAPGVYRAKLYPIGPGETRRVTVRYAEWLGRTGSKGERRLYVYPMAAEGLEASLPHIEELTATFDLSRAGANDVRVGMEGVRSGDSIVVHEHDLVPRADLAVELFDPGVTSPRAYTAAHTIDVDALPPEQRTEMMKMAKQESDYVVVPVRAAEVPLAAGGLDLAIVIDTSAGTDASSLAIARAATTAILSHLGKDDRVAVWAGDASLRPVLPGKGGLVAVDEATRRATASALARLERGGATDLGAMLEQAARTLDPARRGAVIYIGDGAPTVGEIALADLRTRLTSLPHPVRFFGLGVGDAADMAILKGIARGGFAERISDANAAARAALTLLEAAERPAWLGGRVDLGPAVERVFPRDFGAFVADESVVVIGRVVSTAMPTSVTLYGPGGEKKYPLTVQKLDDLGDLRRRWAGERLAQMLDEGTGRAAMVDLGSRHAIITPFTSLYVPTKNEMTTDERAELDKRSNELRARIQNEDVTKPRRWSLFPTKSDDEEATVEQTQNADNKEGGTGTRAKGEEGSMGRPSSRSATGRFGAANDKSEASKPSPPSAVAVAAATAAPQAPPPTATAPARAAGPKGDVALNQPVTGLVLGGGGAVAPKPAASAPGAPAQEARRELKDTEKKPAETAQHARARSDEPATTPPSDGADMDGFASALGNGGGAKDALGGERDHDQSAVAPSAAENGILLLDTAGTTTVTELGYFDKRVDEAKKQKLAKTSVVAGSFRVAMNIDVPHVRFACGAASALPFEERIALWRERLQRVTGNAYGVGNVYHQALSWCEAPTWRERAKLLSMLLDAMPTVRGRVELWRTLFRDLGAADSLYRGILARVRTPAEIRELHDALGLKSIDPQVLDKAIKDAKTPGDRVKKLRELVAVWPDDFALALRLLDALEDVADDGGARELGRKLRARPDADARVRTAVGELYLRISSREQGDAKDADELEARRAFGEIVEFAPDDPVARRRLGDLLRAHRWFGEAARQYETLAKLAPDDANVALLRAAAAEGLGKLEEAVRWTEKGGAAGAPDAEQSSAKTARALSATYLAWGKLAALEGGRAEEASALTARLARVLSVEHGTSQATRGTRVTLVWSHPELHPTLWTNALGAPMPAPDGDVTMGVVSGVVPTRDGSFVEVRLEPDELEHAARLGATATLTALFDEGTPTEKIVKVEVRFTRDGSATQRFFVRGGEVKP